MRRSARRSAVAPIKDHLVKMNERLPAVEIVAPMIGHNECRQYQASLQYASVVTGEREAVKVELSVREPIIESTLSCVGQTLLRHPLSQAPLDTQLLLCVLSLRETYAEKVRAAFTRNPPAIRDIFDIAEVVRTKRLDLSEPGFLNLVRQKLIVAGTGTVDTSPSRLTAIENQLETHLKPILRSSDYTAFDIGGAFTDLEKLAAAIRGD